MRSLVFGSQAQVRFPSPKLETKERGRVARLVTWRGDKKQGREGQDSAVPCTALRRVADDECTTNHESLALAIFESGCGWSGRTRTRSRSQSAELE